MKVQYETKPAIRLKVQMSDNIADYAKDFLAIYNNVKSNSELLKMYNDYGNCVYLVCEPNVQKTAKDFLSQFGEIVEIENVLAIIPIFDIDTTVDIPVEIIDGEEY
jgi:hypothetical protein